MTNIQAINLLKGLEQSLDDYCELNDEGKTAFRMAITALEVFGNSEQLPSVQPEPCEDAVSRQAVIEINQSYHGQMPNEVNHRIWKEINELPSAQPERKGKWLIDKGLYKCSYCNQIWAEWWVAAKPIERMNKELPYCPMCGSYNGGR